MIKHTRYVDDLFRVCGFADSQHEIPVLRAVVTESESAQRTQDLHPIDAQMADVILRSQQDRIPVGLEIRMIAPALFVDLVFIAVQQHRVGVPGESLRDQLESPRRDLVVMVDERNEFSRHESECRVRRRGDSAVLHAIFEPDARITLGVLVECRSRRCESGRVVGNAKLPVWPGLRKNAVETGAQPAVREL